jgi:DNA-binding response OmpR family regulator
MDMKTKRILLVEDEEAVAGPIRSRLEARGQFRVDAVRRAEDALQWLAVLLPDAVLLDTSLPDRPAQEVCRMLRARPRTKGLPCIMLGDPRQGLRMVDGLGFGADDYVVKPVDPEELEARLGALLRRRGSGPLEPSLTAFRGRHLQADFAGVIVSIDGVRVSLTRRELLLLRALVEQCNQTVTREALSNAWGSAARDVRVVDSAMWKLRRKLGPAGRQIETVIGFGYRFNEPQQPGEQVS